jgi:hypothetical protein
MSLRTRACALASTLVITLVGACSSEEIVLARIPASLDDDALGAPMRCADNDDCAPHGFCARARCDDVAGACEPRPVVCADEASPVCGCDGITYWNDCVRLAAGVTAMTAGECTNRPRACGGRRDGPQGGGTDPTSPERCPDGTFCARLLPPSSDPGARCPPDVPGTCWALPAACPKDPGSDRWLSCGGPEPSQCETTCDAIRTGEAHSRARACP